MNEARDLVVPNKHRVKQYVPVRQTHDSLN